MRLKPFLERRIYMRLSAIAGGMELLDHIAGKADGDALLGHCSLRATAPAAQFRLQTEAASRVAPLPGNARTPEPQTGMNAMNPSIQPVPDDLLGFVPQPSLLQRASTGTEDSLNLISSVHRDQRRCL